MKSLLPVLLLLIGVSFSACDNSESNPEDDLFDEDEPECATVTFEFVPGASVAEGLAINTQFEELLGMSFKLADGTDPRIAEVGAPTTAFEPNDSPSSRQTTGDFFLTDDGLLTTEASPLIVSFSVPVDSASGIVLDIDGVETFTIQAYDVSETLLEEVVITAGDPNTGSRSLAPWWFSRETPDVASVRFIGQRPTGLFGLGFDNFTTCAPARLPQSQ